jgi:hypothetical protein
VKQCFAPAGRRPGGRKDFRSTLPMGVVGRHQWMIAGVGKNPGHHFFGFAVECIGLAQAEA